jgi:hypothetical protein
MRLRRRTLAVLVAGVSLLALAGCQKPVPEVGIVSGGTYLTQPASTYCFTLGPAPKCRTGHEAPREVHVREGAAIGVSVPRDVADSPWYLELSLPGQPATAQRSPIQEVGTTYLSLTPRFATAPRLQAEVVSGRFDGRQLLEAGRWRFLLVREAPPAAPAGEPSGS